MKEKLLKFYLAISGFLAGGFLAAKNVFAATPAGDAIGTLEPTPGIEEYGSLSGGDTSGPIRIINNVLLALAVVAGIALLFNIVMAGITVITGAAKPGKLAEAGKRILTSIIGLVLIALAYVIVGFISYFLFGSSDFFLNPTLQGA